jgi:EAL domain-containing protein (putative c-di-GMP-specific phosphodiesterase class I)
VVAEGVETTEQYAFLRSRESDEAQGFDFSRPVMVDEHTRVLLDRRVLVTREPRLTVERYRTPSFV